jgi:glutamine synthetase
MLATANRALARVARRTLSTTTIYEGYGQNVFKGAVADKYLVAQGLPAGALDDYSWTTKNADKVAAAVSEWAAERGASSFCHWFQPLGSSGVRHGLSGQVQNMALQFAPCGTAKWDFKGKDLLKGETDGSSYQNGGLRATHTAGGYLTVDPTSPIFLRGDVMFIPACFISYHGHALDEKTPLIRSSEAMSREGTRLLKMLGYNVKGIQSNIGLEQEFFLIPREAYMKRPDLMLAGRTVIGKNSPRGQEMCDHYMAPFSLAQPAIDAVKDMQLEALKMGIPLRTRHREVAPNQYEMAPLFGSVTTQVDQNVWAMQLIEEMAAAHGLTALLQEKPFNDINGSGKHNNWSIGTTCGTNLLNVGQLAKNSGSTDIFPVIMAAIVSAVDAHGDLLRAAIASPGNDFRLGACEAPPAILSTYLGEDLTKYLEAYKSGSDAAYKPATKQLSLGAAVLPTLEVPAEDRNRTSPFPYGGHRFEFRAVGSSQNVSMVNTVLQTICADAFKRFADAIEKGAKPRDVASAALDKHWKVIFNGNNYDEANQQMLTDRGVWRIDSGVEATLRLGDPKNIALFSEMGVMTEPELAARKDIALIHYAGTVEIEAKTLIDMLNQMIIPAAKQAGVRALPTAHHPPH